MEKKEQGEIVQNVSTDRAGPSLTQLYPPPQSAQPNYVSHNNGVPEPPPTYGTYQHTDPEISNRRCINSKKSIVEAYLLAISPFGLLGAHHFYLQRYYWGIVYFFTAGLGGFGYIIDWFRVPYLVKHANEVIKDPKNDVKTLCDAYTLWFPLGLLGFHHYYLRNYAWGIIYTLTLGLFGIGWIVDVFRMPWIVRAANKKILMGDDKKSACLAMTLAISPFGGLGAHHYYLNRPIWGLVYTFTGGLGGIGWLADWFRTPVLIKRANRIIAGGPNNIKTIDDAYILWFPFGLLGFHHFYLGRPLWGYLYFFTLGIAGMGWLIDMCRIPSLVRAANLELHGEPEKQTVVPRTTSQTNEIQTVTTHVAGYPSYSMAHPVGFMVTNQTVPPYPSQGTFGLNYQQGAYGNPQMSANGPYPNAPYYPSAYNVDMGGPQFQLPPPYQTVEPNHNNQADTVTKTS